MAQTLDALLDQLRESAAMPPHAALYLFSTLDAKAAARVREAWTDWPVELRRRLVARLVELAEADFEANFDAVFRLCLKDEDGDVRATAIVGLWEDQDVRLIPLLTVLLREDEVAAVREAAATSLGRFILLGELGKLHPDPFTTTYDALLAACLDAKECLDVQRRALESLAYVGNETVRDMIREAYGSPEEKVRVSAVFAMGRSADDCWARQVQQELGSPNPELRYEAARACGELQLNDTVPELEELADGADPDIQEAALWALGQIGGERAQEILEHYCNVKDEALQAAAEAALDELMFMHGDLSDLIAKVGKEPGW
ncbi:MAG: hypothetical protein B6I35_11890 [Anaerolineaceae bacterium 4572_32.2]|nr:MAG: hypothetical protein B6I35_11890 [Anaerolineaceae bacterium 4572_32.2]RLC81146.1 MAG: hypothetical protein DRI81_03165 [Chloroflexota bacterium]HEY73936.1 HEAT repeat domain-containing protein [Thermoflexia bacterium]